jgi:drug/metabolite transporter (DMT)-like permease
MTKPQARSLHGLFSALYDKPYILLVLTPLFWGGNMVAGKMALGQVDPYTLIVLRWAGALLAILPFAWPNLRRDWPVIRRSWPILAFYGAVGFATFNVMMYVAAYFTSAVNASLEQSLIPVTVMLGNFLIFGVRARPLQIIGVIITIVGLMFTATHGDPSRILTLSINFGDGLVLLACIAYSAYSLTLRYRPEIHWTSFLATTFTAALVAGIVFQLVLGGGITALPTGIAAMTPKGWWIVFYVAFLPSVVSQLFYARGVQLIGPNRASIFNNLIPVYGTLLSIIILAEPIETYHLITAVLVVAGIALAEISVRRQTQDSEPVQLASKTR